MRRVVVTGCGAVTPIGNTLTISWDAAKSGISGLGPITKFIAAGLKWKVAGEVKDFDSTRFLSPKELLRLDPFVQFTVAAACMAAEDAALRGEISCCPAGYLKGAAVVVGSSRGGITTIERSLETLFKGGAQRRVTPYLMPSTTIGMAPSYAAHKIGATGYCLGLSNACASGANAIGEGYRLIKSGYAFPVFCGGAEAPICRISIEGYGSAGALSEDEGPAASRPFSRTRNGFVISEGAAVLVLEAYETAVARGVRIYGEIVGYGNTVDAFHQTVPSADGESRAIRLALEDAGLQPQDVDFISAHGTSTPRGDRVEAAALADVFGRDIGRIPVTAFKSMTGHLLAGSGALESAFALLALREGIVPPILNLQEKDPECGICCVAGSVKRLDGEFALAESFGFGGLNAVLVFRRLPS
jgi:3-oxoacyl-[acyl-carrier-protein] synthase II